MTGPDVVVVCSEAEFDSRHCHWSLAPCGRCSNHCDCYEEAKS